MLIVDDNKHARYILSQYCSMIEMKITHVSSSAQEALEWLGISEEVPDLVLTDIMMPIMDGFSLVAKIRCMDRMKNVKIVALTSALTPSTPEQSRLAGFDACLSKPVSRADLFGVLLVIFAHAGIVEVKTDPAAPSLQNDVLTKGITVLVAEDNHLNQKLMGILLKQMECVFDIAANGKEVLDMLDNRNYDVLLLDLQMPVMDGFETARIIRIERALTIPVIALTASAFKEDHDKCLAAGMNDFLTKPIDKNELQKKLAKWADKNG